MLHHYMEHSLTIFSKIFKSENVSIIPDQCVYFSHINVVQFLDCMFNLVLVGFDINNEHQSVVVLYLFHGRLSGQRELDDGIVVQPEKTDHRTRLHSTNTQE